MSIDTLQTLEFKASFGKMLGLLAAGIIMICGSAILAFRLIPGIEAGDFGQFIGYVGLVFFGLCTVLILWRAMTMQGTVVTLSPQGIRDIRIAPEVIPWSAIRNVSTWKSQSQRIMVLDVDPETESRLPLSKIARWTREANKKLGADGLCVTAQGINTDYDGLLDATLAYWQDRAAKQ